MPILQPDEWRKMFFSNVDCPDDVFVPTKDYDAYRLNPEHSWAYNKLILAEKQALLCAPHGIAPSHYPVFSKPIYNLKSMGAQSGIIASHKDYEAMYNPGHMWCELLEGEHISTDVAVKDGKIIWSAHTKGYPKGDGMFDYWEVGYQPNDDLDAVLFDFTARNFPHYTGMMNFETIGNKIIEMHLRFSDQWPDLYGPSFVENLVRLYDESAQEATEFEAIPKTGYSVILFLPHKQYQKPDVGVGEALIDGADITSVQFSFDENKSAEAHSMPPGGFRVAIINGFNKDKCLAARNALEELFTANDVVFADTKRGKIAG